MNQAAVIKILGKQIPSPPATDAVETSSTLRKYQFQEGDEWSPSITVGFIGYRDKPSVAILFQSSNVCFLILLPE